MDNQIKQEAEAYITEARTLLPGIPGDLSLIWDKKLIVPGNGTGGTLLKPTVLGIGYDPDFVNKEELSKHLRATILHECFHAVQGWSDQLPTLTPKSLLEDGVLEGAATVFEREAGRTSPPWGLYGDDETMTKWLSLIGSRKLDPDSSHYNEYKFGEIDGVKWMLYKVGTWISDKALANNLELSIADLASKKPEEIIKLSGVQLR